MKAFTLNPGEIHINKTYTINVYFLTDLLKFAMLFIIWRKTKKSW